MNKLGISGNTAKHFLTTQITPLLALVGVLLGLFAVMVTPREEDPQINVTFANVFIAFPGATAAEVESLVATPAEQVISEIEGIEHVYSTSTPGMAILTVQFLVGENRTDAIVRLIAAKPEPVVFLLWGSHAQKKAAFVQSVEQGGRHLVLAAPHPSPLSAYHGFFGCKHFSKANAFLEQNGQAPIDWSLPDINLPMHAYWDN